MVEGSGMLNETLNMTGIETHISTHCLSWLNLCILFYAIALCKYLPMHHLASLFCNCLNFPPSGSGSSLVSGDSGSGVPMIEGSSMLNVTLNITGNLTRQIA